MKLLAFDARERPQDYDDVMSLLQNAEQDDVTRAEASVALIAERGFHRGKDLAKQLGAALRRVSSGA